MPRTPSLDPLDDCPPEMTRYVVRFGAVRALAWDSDRPRASMRLLRVLRAVWPDLEILAVSVRGEFVQGCAADLSSGAKKCNTSSLSSF